MRGLLAALLVLAAGCTQTTRQAVTQTDDRARIDGTANVPGVGVVPITLTVDRTVRATEDSEERTRIDGRAIGQEIGDAAGTAIKATMSSATGGLGGGLIDMVAELGAPLGLAGLIGIEAAKARARSKQVMPKPKRGKA